MTTLLRLSLFGAVVLTLITATVAVPQRFKDCASALPTQHGKEAPPTLSTQQGKDFAPAGQQSGMAQASKNWTNPTSGKTITLAGQWVSTVVKEGPGPETFYFTSQSPPIRAIVNLESLTDTTEEPTLAELGESYRQAATSLALQKPAIRIAFEPYVEVWESHGHRKEDKAHRRAILISRSRGGNLWEMTFSSELLEEPEFFVEVSRMRDAFLSSF